MSDPAGRGRLVFKILKEAEWGDAVAAATYAGSAVDHEDGFIHLSGEDQVRETAARYFAGEADLVIVAFSEHDLAGLTWEPSRGGELFPHVHGAISTAAAQWVRPLPLVDGVHVFSEEPPGYGKVADAFLTDSAVRPPNNVPQQQSEKNA